MIRFMRKSHTILSMVLVMGLSCIPVAWADLNDGLVAHYPFNGNANDASGNGNDGTVNGATLIEDRFGSLNNAYSFDGVDDYISVSDSEMFTIGINQFAISIWVNFTQIKGRDPFIGHDEGGGNNNKWIFWYDAIGHNKPSGSALRWHMTDPTLPSLDTISSPWEPSSGQWYHIAITKNTDVYTIYINGVQIATDIDSNAIPNPNTMLTIGKAESFLFNGLIDDVSIYNRALSECEVKSLYTGKDDCISPQVCKLYAVHDEGLNNSQFLTISPETFEVNTLGKECSECDIEALDIHPQTGELFAASGNDTNEPAHLYHVDKTNGQLTGIGFTGMKEIDGLSFHPDGTLWGWSTGDGLITIDTTTGQATLVVAYSGEVEDLTWNKAGTILYGVENLVDGSPDIGTRLISYNGTTITHVCEELTQSLGLEIEALDTLPDDTLIFGLHDRNNLPLGVIDVANCQIIAEQEIPTSYDDVEGIAWPENCTE